MASAQKRRRDIAFARVKEMYTAMRSDPPLGKYAFFAQYENLANLVTAFDNAHLKVISDASDEEFDEQDAVRSEFDQMRYALTTRYFELNANPGPSENQSRGERSNSNVKLPKISLPKFDGDIALWSSFYDLYESLIHNNASLRSMEKYQYLVASLEGEALKIIKSLPLSEDHYQIAYDAIVERYQNKRRLATHFWKSIRNATLLKSESPDALQRLLDTFDQNKRALAQLAFPVEQWDFILFNLLFEKLTPSLTEKFESEHRKTEIPTYSQLFGFLKEYHKVLSTVDSSTFGSKTHEKPRSSTKETKGSFKHSVSAFVTSAATCVLCNSAHTIQKCSRFLAQPPRERYLVAKNNNLCLNCLHAGHTVKNCTSSWKCRSCKSNHNTLLHFAENSLPNSNEVPISNAPAEEPTTPNLKSSSSKTTVMTSFVDCSSTVLLATIRALIPDLHGNLIPVRILLDNASQSNFITENCVARCGLARTPYSATVLAVNDIQAAKARGRTSFVLISGLNKDIHVSLEATILSQISSRTPTAKLERKSWSDLDGLDLADPQFYESGPIDILIGAELFVSFLKGGRRLGTNGTPDALETLFGWVLMGRIHNTLPHSPRLLMTIESDFGDIIRRFWEIENVPEFGPQSEEDRKCEENFVATTYRAPDGRFVVFYPFKGNDPIFTDTRNIAIRRFLSVERRFKIDSNYRDSYCAFMQNYIDEGHMELVSQPFPVDGRIFYLPHHGVLRPESHTTKLRVVFDASVKSPSGISLNQTLIPGPKLQPDLNKILLNFRIGQIAITADIKQMFRQIWIDPSQQDYQRVVWRSSPDVPIQDYRLKTVTFGVTSSPYLAIRSIKRSAEMGRDKYPLAAQVLETSVYVDDVVTSVHNLELARELQRQLRELLSDAGFTLRKWASSHLEVLKDIPAQDDLQSTLAFDSNEDGLKILGLRWYPATDSFGFQVSPLKRDCTKRVILSELARIFDPLGFISPLTFLAKTLIQELWTLGLDWDESPPEKILLQWKRYLEEMPSLSNCKVPRALAVDQALVTQLHGYCDASEKGYGCVIYLRTVTPTGVKVQLLYARSKVAPLKPLTLPRLELCAALLLSNSLKYIRSTYQTQLTIDQLYAWSDSMITLYWIKSSPGRWKTFVRNRVASIQENLDSTAWRHVQSEHNPADPCSRGLFPQELTECDLWWNGPSALLSREIDWPLVDVVEPDNKSTSEEETASFVLTLPSSSLDKLLFRFSSLGKILRIVAYFLRLAQRARKLKLPETLSVDQVEAQTALLALVKYVQSSCFKRELKSLRENTLCSKPIRKLCPFIDSHGIIRVGGRLPDSTLPYESKHPALLPSNHRLTELIVEDIHTVHLHPGKRTMQYLLSRKFWVLASHRAIGRCISRCFRCVRVNPRAYEPLMAPLPKPRVTEMKPFSTSGVDFAGPFFLVSRRGRGVVPRKAYICLFVCFAVKAVHLELVHSLSTDSFLAALRRFVARRGRCSDLYSDCGTNFVGASNELSQLMKLASEKETIKWSFSPPSAPHFGGIWESGVKSTKTHLKRVIGNQILTIEEFETTLLQIEAVLNSRPLTPVSSDPNDLEVLTPGHFLTMEPLVAIPEPDLTSIPTNRLNRWQFVQRIQQEFWKRWHSEYLHSLQQRSKWLKITTPPKLGTLVLIKNENTPPLKWVKGRITELHQGHDGIVRVASVRTATTNLVRPLVKLCPLLLDEPASE